MTKVAGAGQGRGARKTFADRIGIKAKRRDPADFPESASEECIADIGDDQDTTFKEDEIIYYKAQKIVPRQELKLGMSRSVTKHNQIQQSYNT